VADAPLPCWRRRLGALGFCGAMGWRRWGHLTMWSRAADAGAAAPDGGGTSRWRPRSPLQLQRSYGARSCHCLALGGDPAAAWAARSSTRLVRLRAMRRSSWLLRRDGGPESMVLGWRLGYLCGRRVCRPVWFVFGQCEGCSRWYVGAAAPELEVCLLRW
jgi:hypothetical protein